MEGLLGSNSEDANMNKPQLLPSWGKFGIAQTRSSEEATAGYCSDAHGVLEREIEWGQIKKQIKRSLRSLRWRKATAELPHPPQGWI